jgi:hypothetical protein
MHVNYDGKDESSGYYYYIQSIRPGFYKRIEVYKFRNSDGRQFFPGDEVFNFLIQAETEDGRTGTYLKKWTTNP